MRIEKMYLKKLNNTRDLGGLPASDGMQIKKNKLIRSGKLYKLPLLTRERLKRKGVTTVIDLRIDNEVEEYPSTPIEGANYVRIPLVCTATAGITHDKSMARLVRMESKRLEKEFGSADEYMHKAYIAMLFNAQSIESLQKIFRIFLEEEGCVLWHCSGGKDRAGMVAMLLEGLLGVEESVLIDDYVASQKFQRRKRNLQKLGLKISPISGKFKQILYAFMDAKPQYIRGAIAEINARYGSIEGYCKEALELSDEEICALRKKYLEPESHHENKTYQA